MEEPVQQIDLSALPPIKAQRIYTHFNLHGEPYSSIRQHVSQSWCQRCLVHSEDCRCGNLKVETRTT